MNCSGSFGTQHAVTEGVHVSSKVVSSVPADSAKVASTSVSTDGFKDAFAAASEAASTHKSQSSAKQSDDKKGTRDKQPAQDSTTPAVTAPDTKTSLPLTVAVVVPAAPQWALSTSDSKTQDSVTSDPGGKGVVSLSPVPSAGGETASGEDKTNADEGVASSAEDMGAMMAGGTASAGDITGSLVTKDAGIGGKPAPISGDTNDAFTATGLPDDARSVSTGTSAMNSPAPLIASGDSEAVAAKQSIKAAAMPVLPSASDMTAAHEGGSAVMTKSTAPSKDAGKGSDLAKPETTNQDAVLANSLPLTMPASAQPLVPGNQSMAKAGSALDSGLGSVASLKSGGSKPTVAGKDRAETSDVKSKEKSEDEDTQSSSTGTDASFAAKITTVVASVDHQAANSHSGSAGGDAVQQAVQAAATNSAPANASPSESVAASDSTHGAAQATVPAQAASATQAQELPTLNSAHLVQSMGQSEMKLGMHSAEFGSISINTSLTHQALSAQISISHSALGQALAAHLPSIEQKLGSAYGLQARVEVKDSSSSSAGDSGRQSQDSRQSQTSGSSSTGSSIAGIGMAAAPAATTTSLLAGSSRLDIRI